MMLLDPMMKKKTLGWKFGGSIRGMKFLASRNCLPVGLERILRRSLRLTILMWSLPIPYFLRLCFTRASNVQMILIVRWTVYRAYITAAQDFGHFTESPGDMLENGDTPLIDATNDKINNPNLDCSTLCDPLWALSDNVYRYALAGTRKGGLDECQSAQSRFSHGLF